MGKEATAIKTRGAMPKYCLQNVITQMAYCPLSMAAGFMLGKGISSSAAGVAIALGNVLALVIQPWVSSTADGRRGPSVAQLSLAASLGLVVAYACGVILPGPVLTMASVVAVFMLFMNLLALVNSISVYYINRGASINYGVARGMGSLSYAIVASVIGVIAERFGPESYFVLGAGFSALMAAAMLLLPTPKDVPPTTGVQEDEGADVSYGSFVRENPKFLILVVGVSLAFVMASATSTYALPVMQSVGGGEAEMGFAMALQAVFELPGMWGYNWLEKRIKTSTLLMFSVAMYAVKGFVFCIATDIAMIYVAYALQVVSFGIWTPASISYANKFFHEGNKNKAVGLLSLIFSFAGVVASPVAGWAIDTFGLLAMLVIVEVCAVVGVILARIGLQREDDVETA